MRGHAVSPVEQAQLTRKCAHSWVHEEGTIKVKRALATRRHAGKGEGVQSPCAEALFKASEAAEQSASNLCRTPSIYMSRLAAFLQYQGETLHSTLHVQY
jgi:hypothetical protein